MVAIISYRSRELTTGFLGDGLAAFFFVAEAFLLTTDFLLTAGFLASAVAAWPGGLEATCFLLTVFLAATFFLLTAFFAVAVFLLIFDSSVPVFLITGIAPLVLKQMI
jgi:hypothetical protein